TRGPLRRRARALLLQRRELRAPRPRRGARSRAGRARHRDRAGLRAAPEVPHLPAVRAAQHRRDAVLDPRPRRGPQPGGDGLVGPARLGTMSAMSRRATIIDVAQRAGVSRQTVSRAMNDLPGISAGTREKVLAAAQELNYRPSRFGRGLVEQGPVTLGLVVEDLSNAYFAELGAAVVRACAPHGWNVVLAEALHAPHPERVAADLARRVDALVGYGVLTADIRGGGGMPVVQLDGRESHLAEGGVVELARTEAMAELAAHLAESGARRPVVLDLVGGLGRSRSLALAAALRPLVDGGEVPVREIDARTGHRDSLEEILAGGVDTIVAFNDELAVRLLRALRELD